MEFLFMPFIHVGKEENHISLYAAPNDLKILWSAIYAMSSL
jgi:hypothetical protein